MVNLVAGRYVFTLTVVDGEGLQSTDKASLLVKEGNDSKQGLSVAQRLSDFH